MVSKARPAKPKGTVRGDMAKKPVKPAVPMGRQMKSNNRQPRSSMKTGK